MFRALLALGFGLCLAPPGIAQQSIEVQATTEVQDGRRVQVQSPILTVDSERLFRDSVLGQQITSEVETAGIALQEQNDRIAAELEKEELELTRKRAEMSPEDFRAVADAFDEKAQRIRGERAAELRELNQRLDDERRAFLQAAGPILEQIMREAGAAVVLEQRDVFISSLAVDITNAAIARIDAATVVEEPAEE